MTDAPAPSVFVGIAVGSYTDERFAPLPKVLDTCYSGDAGIPALTVASRVLEELQVSDHSAWVGVLTATLPLERARDGVLADRLARLLREGPIDPVLRRRWSPHDACVRLEDVADAVMKEWDDPSQSPTFRRDGSAWPILPNPLFDPAAPAASVEHLLLAARGADPGQEGSFFTGRVGPIGRVVAWMRQGSPGVLVVTGPAGSGKSAIVGRIVSVSDVIERSCVLESGPLEHDDPGEGSVHARIHARGLTAERLVKELDRQLVDAGVLPRFAEGARNRGEIFGALERAGTAPLVAIDGLDESGPESWRIAEDVIRLLRTNVRFVIGTRDIGGDRSLVDALAPDDLIDLGDPELALETSEDAVGYVVKRLASVTDAKMDGALVGHTIVHAARFADEGAFLLARIVTAQLRESPVDTTAPGWERSLATTVDAALESDLASIPTLDREGTTVPSAARELLTALAWSYGAGVPEDLWAVAAGGVSPTGTRYGRDDVLWLLSHAGRYVIESGEGGQAAYRLAHQRLADLLLPSRRIDRVEAAGAQLSERLVERYVELLGAGVDADKPAYLWRYAWRHAADGGGRGVDAFRRLVAIDRAAFVPDLAMALNNLGVRYSEVGRRADAVAPTEEAVRIRRELAAENPAFVPDLAGALNNLGVRYSEVGRRADAVAPTEEAAASYRELAAENPAFLPNLAGALNNLGIRYSEVGRYDDVDGWWDTALTCIEDANARRWLLSQRDAAL